MYKKVPLVQKKGRTTTTGKKQENKERMKERSIKKFFNAKIATDFLLGRANCSFAFGSEKRIRRKEKISNKQSETISY